MIITQQELDRLSPEEYSEFLSDGILVDDDEPIYCEETIEEF